MSTTSTQTIESDGLTTSSGVEIVGIVDLGDLTHESEEESKTTESEEEASSIFEEEPLSKHWKLPERIASPEEELIITQQEEDEFLEISPALKLAENEEIISSFLRNIEPFKPLHIFCWHCRQEIFQKLRCKVTCICDICTKLRKCYCGHRTKRDDYQSLIYLLRALEISLTKVINSLLLDSAQNER